MKVKIKNILSVSIAEIKPEATDSLNEFISKAECEEGHEFNLKKFIPVPIEVDEEWFRELWGTDKEFKTKAIQREEHKITYEIYSYENGLNAKFIRNISKAFPFLVFNLKSNCTGEVIKDEYIIKVGKIIKENHESYEPEYNYHEDVINEAMLAKLKEGITKKKKRRFY